MWLVGFALGTAEGAFVSFLLFSAMNGNGLAGLGLIAYAVFCLTFAGGSLFRLLGMTVIAFLVGMIYFKFGLLITAMIWSAFIAVGELFPRRWFK